ncbi:MAG: hypothetical protein ACOZAN_02690 [Patescibacteria group bacterium]
MVLSKETHIENVRSSGEDLTGTEGLVIDTYFIESKGVRNRIPDFDLGEVDQGILEHCLDKGFFPSNWFLSADGQFKPGLILNGITWRVLIKLHPELIQTDRFSVYDDLFYEEPAEQELREFVRSNCKSFLSSFKSVFGQEYIKMEKQIKAQVEAAKHDEEEREVKDRLLKDGSERLLAGKDYQARVIVARVNYPFSAEKIAFRINHDENRSRSFVRNSLLKKPDGYDFGGGLLGQSTAQLLKVAISNFSLEAGLFMWKPKEIYTHLETLIEGVTRSLEVEYGKFRSGGIFLTYCVLGTKSEFDRLGQDSQRGFVNAVQ